MAKAVHALGYVRKDLRFAQDLMRMDSSDKFRRKLFASYQLMLLTILNIEDF